MVDVYSVGGHKVKTFRADENSSVADLSSGGVYREMEVRSKDQKREVYEIITIVYRRIECNAIMNLVHG